MKYEKLIINNRESACPLCGCTDFTQQQAQLNTAGMTLLGLDWANEEADCFVCRDCGHILWFKQG